MTGPENYVKDVSIENLSKRQLASLNNLVESEFLKFMENKTITNDNREEMQKKFNERIQEIVNTVKNKEIKEAIKNIKNFELVALDEELRQWWIETIKSNIIDVEETLKKLSKNTDWTIDRQKVTTFNTNMSILGFYSYEDFSKALNDKLLEDRKIILNQNKWLEENKINTELKKAYNQVVETMVKQQPEGVNMENMFPWFANQVFTKLTGAYITWTYTKLVWERAAYHIDTDKDKWLDAESQEIEGGELSQSELRKLSKEMIKFLNSESLSWQEKKEIRFFARTVAWINKNNTSDTSVEYTILNFFSENINELLNYTSDDRLTKIPGLQIKNNDAKRLQKLWQMYYQTRLQEKQTLRRLFDFIKQEQWLKKTSLDKSISESNANKKEIKQESRNIKREINSQAGQKLNYSTKDLANAQAYLNLMKLNESNDEKKIIHAITDFDLDWHATQKDVGIKSWPQIQTMIRGFWEEKSLNNILALANKIWSRFELEKITKENLFSDPAYLLLIQNILKNPSFEISDILRYGDQTIENKYTLSEESKKTIEEQTNGLKDELIKKWIPVEAWLKDLLSTSVIQAYSDRWYWVWISLDDFIKWLSISTAVAQMPTGPESFGINISRNGRKELPKRREVIWWASAGTTLLFIPMASVQWGFIKTTDNKKQQSSLDVRTNKRIEISGHAIFMPGNFWYWGNIGIERNKWNAIVNEQWPKLKSTLQGFFTKMLSPEEWEKKFTFNKSELLNKLSDTLKEDFKNTKKETREKAVNNMSIILAQYDWLPIENIPQAVSQISESYVNSRINQSARDIDNKWYIGWWWLSITFFESIIPIVWIINFKKHKITSSNDINYREKLQLAQSGEWNEIFKWTTQELITEINTQSWTEIRLEWEYIIIPKSDKIQVKINQNMKGLIMINNKWELIIHKDTPMRPVFHRWSDAWTNELTIWDFQKSNDEIDRNKQTIPEDFKTDKIDPEKIPVKLTLDTENINQILEDLKSKFKDWKENPIKELKVEVTWSTAIFKNWETEIWKIENISNTTKITINLKNDGTLGISSTEVKDQTRFTIEYKKIIERAEKDIAEEHEISSDDTHKMLSTMYSEGRQITDNLFHNIIHNQTPLKYKFKEHYDNFNQKIKNQDYQWAKSALIIILDQINAYTKDRYNKETFLETRKNLENITDDYQLVQFLSAFNVFFSRVANVKVNKDGKYTYRYGSTKEKDEEVDGNKVLEESERRIITSNKWFLQNFSNFWPKENWEIKSTFNQNNIQEMFNLIKEKRQQQGIHFENQPTSTKNTISFNHGNPQDFFKLQINPEIVSDFRIWLDSLKWEKGQNENFIEDLKLAYINQLINTESILVRNILKKAWIEQELSPENLMNLFEWKRVDINDKIYIHLNKYEQKFWYNPECNNLMRLLEDLKIIKVEKSKLKEEETLEAKLKWNGVMINYSESENQTNMQTKAFDIMAAVAQRREKNPDRSTGDTDPDKDPWNTNPDKNEENPDRSTGDTDPDKDTDKKPESKPNPKPQIPSQPTSTTKNINIAVWAYVRNSKEDWDKKQSEK
jgi:hypothetical protein